MISKRIQRTYWGYRELADAEEKLVEKFFNDKITEEEYDEISKAFWDKRKELVQMLMNVTGCEMSVANAMIASEKLETLMSKTIVA